MSALLFFIDGLGIGTRGPHNPLDGLREAAPLAIFQDEEAEIIHDGKLVRTDAKLGVEGRPQSASGQTTILTGVNARLLWVITNRIPNSTATVITPNRLSSLEQENLAQTLSPSVHTALFENRPRGVRQPPWRWRRGEDLQNLDDLHAGRALFRITA